MTPWEICCHKIFRAMNKTWLWNIKSSHLSTFSLSTTFFLLLNTALFLCQGKGMSCKANDLVWLKTPGNEQVTQESHWLMGNKPCHWNVSRMQRLHCVFMWQCCNTSRAGGKYIRKAFWRCVNNYDANYCMHHTNVPSARMLDVSVKRGAL